MDKVDIFCGISSLGMPFPKENKNHIGYYDIIVETLKSEGYNVSGFNMSRLNKNHTWDLESNLNDDVSLAHIKHLQLMSIDALRNTNVLFKLVVPKKYKESFKTSFGDDNTLKSLYVNAKNPIFLYQGGVNDFFSYIQAGPVELMDRSVRAKIPNDLNHILERCISNVENNWNLLHSLNSNVQIYALSFCYAPLFDKIQKYIFFQEKMINKNKTFVNRFMEVIKLYNGMLLQASKKYSYVDYCDITFIKDYCAPMDFHPNTMGNRLIADMLLRKIKLEISIDELDKEQRVRRK